MCFPTPRRNYYYREEIVPARQPIVLGPQPVRVGVPVRVGYGYNAPRPYYGGGGRSCGHHRGYGGRRW
ncbi:hypothetical protein SPI_08946 [Niveomyces insectorum RCEF 264]|uniref:Uncharacterized protein n=1 Tax=Niveomyces insectorum RCEF 264 TaxID=1081102 RepID=A0A167MGL7_9HYPO|nr:hypothetical protein SPI_08946 [Niveomyces insectorum RCEF 264]